MAAGRLLGALWDLLTISLVTPDGFSTMLYMTDSAGPRTLEHHAAKSVVECRYRAQIEAVDGQHGD